LEEEVMQMEDKFPSILESFQTVAAVDVDGESFSLEAKVKSDLRKDECFSSLGQERALANAPLQANGHFRVPAVL
jgi:aspartyl/glutamyl-tRNA(Asn/Gln) amidotransferase C subunit